MPNTLGDEEWQCPKCGAQADERFDCCEVRDEPISFVEQLWQLSVDESRGIHD